MKTIELYLLLILFFNVFSDDINPTTDTTTTTNSINSDTSLSTTDSSPTNSDTSLSTTDSSPTNSDTSLSTTDSSPTNSDTSLSTTDSSPTNSDTSVSTTDSSPTNSDTSLSTTDSSPTNSDISLSTIDSTNGNSTQIADQPRIVLIGFGSYKRVLRDLVTFRVYFKRFLTRASSRYLYFTVVLNYLRRLRVLEDQDQGANCTLITDNNNDMVYNCSVPVDANRDFTMSAKDNFEFSDIETNLIVSSYANSTMKSLSSQTNDIFENGVLVLTDSTLTNNDNNFIIEGNLMDGELNDKQVILSFDENGNGNLVNATCNVNDKENKKYELICTSTQKIKAHLEGVMGRTSSEKPLLIHMASNSNDEVDLDSSSSSSKLNHIYPKTSSSGLSTGAIVGIIIPCCVVLIAAVAAAFICSKQNIAPIQEMNTLQSNSSNTMIKNYIN
jgi:hypothetical protein